MRPTSSRFLRATAALVLASLALTACATEITGTFGAEYDADRQRGCFYVDTEDGERYEIGVPSDWSGGDFGAGTLIDENGVAQIQSGDRVVIRGKVDDSGTFASNPCSERGDPYFSVDSIEIAE